jgi:monothiol glutaredoxin
MTSNNVRNQIESTIQAHDVVLFMKGTPEFPMCGFSGRVVQILEHFGQKVFGVNVLEDDAIRNGIKEYSNWPTLPQLYIKGQFLGGCDITVEMAQSGELEKLLREKNLLK